jgi:hypothetical protein
MSGDDSVPSDKEIQEFLDFWKDRVELPNPEHHPKCFKYYWKLWEYYDGR